MFRRRALTSTADNYVLRRVRTRPVASEPMDIAALPLVMLEFLSVCQRGSLTPVERISDYSVRGPLRLSSTTDC